MARYYLQDGAEVPTLREARKAGAVPSVTTVINAMAPHSYKFMDDKRLREALEDDRPYDEKLEQLGNKPVFESGTLVHEGAEIYVESGLRSTLLDCPVSSKQLFDLYDGLTDIQMEKPVYVEGHGYGGRLDWTALAGKRQALGDLKTVSSVKKKPEKTWLMQLGAYYHGLLLHGIHCEVGYIFQFSKKNLGTIALEISEADIKEGWEMFKQARLLYKYFYNI